MKQKRIMHIIIILILIIAGLAYFWQKDFSKGRLIEFGVTFGKPHAEYLGLDWKEVYLAALDDLGVKKLRLSAYWNEIEKQEGIFDFSDLDWQVKEAQKRGVEIIMCIGRRLPRWPECHVPKWASALDEQKQQEKIVIMFKEVVNRYKNYENIKVWQVDNEPLVEWFGACPKTDIEFVKKEIALVKSLDDRPALITDSGELSSWRKASKLGDLFGTTMYRVVWNKYIGYWNYDYLLPPTFYNLKARLWGLSPKDALITELQAEAWAPEGVQATPLEEQKKSMNAVRLKKTAQFAQRTGFGSAYFWGVEYWYWLKEKGDSSLWQAAREIF